MPEEDFQKNVLGEKLETCSENPLTGWFRDGCCNTNEIDHGVHTVCAKVTKEFLDWAKNAGNDLITPHPEFNFPGLKEGDSWCICAGTYAEAIEAQRRTRFEEFKDCFHLFHMGEKLQKKLNILKSINS